MIDHQMTDKMTRVMRPATRLFSGLLIVGTLVATLTTAGCLLGEAGPGPAYYDDYPPDSYIATTDPYYYEGRPVYWYGGRWYYREGRAWRHYEHEPPALYERRVRVVPQRHVYERWHGRATPGRAAPVGRGSWHRH